MGHRCKLQAAVCGWTPLLVQSLADAIAVHMGLPSWSRIGALKSSHVIPRDLKTLSTSEEVDGSLQDEVFMIQIQTWGWVCLTLCLDLGLSLVILSALMSL